MANVERVDRYKIFSSDYTHTDVYVDDEKRFEEIRKEDSYGNIYVDVYDDHGKKIGSHYVDD